MKAIVLNYVSDCVEIIDLPSNLVDEDEGYITTENIEDYLHEEYGFNLDEINYMTTENDSIPVFYNGKEEPTTTL